MSHVKVSPPALVLILALSGSVFGAAKDARSYVVSRYALTLDGVNCGFLKSVEGGNITAEVIQEPVGPDYIVRKHVGKPKYEDFEIQVSIGSMSKPLYEWIRQSWSANYRRAKGSIVAMDFNYQPKSEQQFFEALITETTIPAMDGASKEPGYLTLKFSPEYPRPGKPSGTTKPDAMAEKQKMFLPANFRLEIAGLNCKTVSRIESFTVKQRAVRDDIGDARDQKKEPGKLEFPNLKITLAEKGAEAWLAWHEDFVVKGNNNQDKEKSGSLTLLSPNLKDELLTIRFSNMGIFSLKPEKGEANSEAIRRLVAELYVEKMEFEMKGNVVGSSTTDTTPTATATSATPAREAVPAARMVLKRPD